MEVFYYLVFGALGAVVAALELSKTTKDRINTSPAFNSFKNNYLLVYSLMMGNFSFLCFSLVDLVSHRLLVTHCLFLRHSDPVFLWIWSYFSGRYYWNVDGIFLFFDKVDFGLDLLAFSGNAILFGFRLPCKSWKKFWYY